MTSAPRRKDQQPLSKELQNPPRPDGSFEDIPGIAKVAGPSNGPRTRNTVAILTGCNSPLGIGRATAHHLAANGARALYLCDITSTHLSTHARELSTLYPSCTIHTRELDAADEEAVKQVCDDALKEHGRLDVMFANAGVGDGTRFEDMDSTGFMRVVRGNLLTAFLCAKHAALAMQKTGMTDEAAENKKQHPGGSIILTASAAGLRSNAGSTSYSASKAGVISLAQTLAYQLAGTGVRVNAVCPGIIETGMTSAMYDYARAKGTEGKIGQLNPLQRGGVADEVARVALFLASEEGSYVNGQGWAVDGGLSAGLPFVRGKLA
ncbi:MAG: hypothetical protein M1831_002767 [Alyxoria varia]|nr:MAG: hypothetical protein M1831_002767 [Alyxoria varia]